MNWEIEQILDYFSEHNPSFLYYRIHKTYHSKRRPLYYKSPSAFKYSPEDGKMSTNWSKYSTPSLTREGTSHPPEDYGVVSFIVYQIRMEKELDKLRFEHDPKPENQAHTNINGLQKYENISVEDYRQVQVILARMAKWEITFS